jgi:hypothetical protein
VAERDRRQDAGDLSTQTNTYSGDNLYYELRIKFLDSSHVTAEAGTFHIRASNVDRP